MAHTLDADAGRGPREPRLDASGTPASLGLRRSSTDTVVAGVAGGVGERLGVDPVVVRLAFVVLAAAAGFGVLLYLLVWLLSAEPDPRAAADQREPAIRYSVATAFVVAGALLLLREAGMWFGDALVWPVALGAFGSAVIWTKSDPSERARLTRLAAHLPGKSSDLPSTGRVSPLRIIAGGLLISAGLAVFLAANDALSAARNVAFAVGVTAAGALLIVGPWLLRLARQLSDERKERIRSQERAELAAHLHDSVLQTLALIQRSDAPEEIATLARGQERELRTWLYGRKPREGGDTVGRAIEASAARTEALHKVRIETVVVGDHPLDDRLGALVDAACEAMVNAARHSGARVVSVYVEAATDAVEVFVRDQGRGFEMHDVADDREGIAGSIAGRMRRAGGDCSIKSAPGHGTEIHLTMPLAR